MSPVRRGRLPGRAMFRPRRCLVVHLELPTRNASRAYVSITQPSGGSRDGSRRLPGRAFPSRESGSTSSRSSSMGGPPDTRRTSRPAKHHGHSGRTRRRALATETIRVRQGRTTAASLRAPHGGRFIIHGDEPRMLEGDNPGTVIVIEFPDLSDAERWYTSDSYQAILTLRTEHSTSTVFLVQGVDADHRATDVLCRS